MGLSYLGDHVASILGSQAGLRAVCVLYYEVTEPSDSIPSMTPLVSDIDAVVRPKTANMIGSMSFTTDIEIPRDWCVP